ncbi:MAG: hypothetical protein HOI19_06880 [Rhodospirillaceae bacterium]|nr:hypothetical protein [Rhodospirillaceae bacterium]
MRRLPTSFITVPMMAIFATTVAAAEPAVTPRIESAIHVELQTDIDHNSDDPANERNNVFLKVEPELTLHLPAGFTVFGHGVVEQVKAADPDEDRYFKDEGFFIDELYLRYESGPFIVTGGKLNPGFGRAWDAAPGIYGADAPEDYEISERIGLTAAFNFGGGAGGDHKVTAGAFFLDTTFLSHSLGTSRGTIGRADGGVSNTEDFSSFNVMLEGGGVKALPGLEYHLAYIHQANGVDADSNEMGVAGFAAYPFNLGSGVQVTPMVELVRFENLGGVRGIDRDYNTVALSGEWRGWNAALSHTRRDTDSVGGGATRDRFYSLGLGYTFDFGLTADVGWKRARESGLETDTFGTLFTYTIKF